MEPENTPGPSKRRNICKPPIVGFHISFRGCMFIWHPVTIFMHGRVQQMQMGSEHPSLCLNHIDMDALTIWKICVPSRKPYLTGYRLTGGITRCHLRDSSGFLSKSTFSGNSFTIVDIIWIDMVNWNCELCKLIHSGWVLDAAQLGALLEVQKYATIGSYGLPWKIRRRFEKSWE